ncbi:hypothetical protein HUZ36_13945 [Pseudoalteromonas sp. McH1-7]|uniref:Uncharacterized protein n=1 Tax=Pseudoalteromonas peptidolytica F12-50-A1 TaxID=1315280 RepID=A0A8I0T595_9GAMM|nr:MULTISPECIES: hypothetical protein [Pseudoalteromonas]MBE0347835.1 hypothetical protein [Pseudoalteromonas peptidolytica F12-50-A1]NLR15257.1 hypothetical protein [Pseudoalteromonas peptidolytica]NUZ11885.1 hypothetical protein [Pseudoalteromonas sp. McH1-7]USD31120.1 hypothetical protein J8Z24_21665 [Pseudoalteromonas sp. SCSIO 43201]GEK10256.1 hypothetical protein PPE03_25050 [Pseudoalteromonas peptidolytica]
MALLNDFKILKGGGGGGAAYRREDILTSGVIAPKQFESLSVKMGQSITLTKLEVSAPCLIRIFGKKDFSDPNPFEFLAYPSYLSYEGAVWDTLGTVWGNNRYPTLINKDEFPNNKLYWHIANPSDDPIQITVDFGWLVLEE